MTLTELQNKIFLDRYARRNSDGVQLESQPEQMWQRVAKAIASVEDDKTTWGKKFYDTMVDFKFVPGGRILSSAGGGFETTAFNCYVIDSPVDSRGGIFDNLKLMTEIMARGGGVGVNLSTLRPRGSYIKTVNGTSSGPVSWAELYSVTTKDIVQQGGCVAPDTKILTDKGLLSAAILADRLDNQEEIRAYTHKGYKRFTAVFRNGMNPVFRVKTARGFSLDVTADHKMGTLVAGQLTTIPLKNLRVGSTVLNLLGKSTGEVASLLPIDISAYVGNKSYKTEVTFPSTLTPELAYVLGYMYGNAYVLDHDHGISLAIPTSHSTIAPKLAAYITKLFNIEAKILPVKGENRVNITLWSTLVVQWLRHNQLLKEKSADIVVPEIVYRATSDVCAAFIAGYFDADGCDRGAKGGYGFDSISLPMLQGVQQLLASSGILSHIHTTDRGVQGWQTIYRLVVSGSLFKKLFSTYLSLSEKAMRGVPGARDESAKYPLQFWKNQGIQRKYSQGIWDGMSDVSYRAVSRVEEKLRTTNTTLSKQLQEILRYTVDTIVTIEPLASVETFDFEVADVHMYSGNGMYIHNSRRGALMICLDDDHPDILEFITSKEIDPLTNQPKALQGANISVGVSDTFMEAVAADGEWQTQFPTRRVVATGDTSTITYGPKYRAKDVWYAICEGAWRTADPGLIFLERTQKQSNTYWYENITSTNPCGEIGLSPYGVCNLGAMNLSAYVHEGAFDYAAFGADVATAVRFLDNVIDYTYYFLPENKEVQQNTRRLGLGTMGIADALIKLGVRYGSDEGNTLVEHIYATLRNSAYAASIELAKEKGTFKKYKKTKYLAAEFIQRLPQALREGIAEHGIRNAALLCAAPTGSTALLAESSSGIEPVFDFQMQRTDRTGTSIIYHPLAETWLAEHPGEQLPEYFVRTDQLSTHEHVVVQSIVQRYNDQGVSKTVNGANSDTVQDVMSLYQEAYDLGCKGVTYYRDGSRDAVLTHLAAPQGTEVEVVGTLESVTDTLYEQFSPRPKRLQGETIEADSPSGTMFVTINNDQYGPREVFVTVGRGGSDTNAEAEAIGRLISLVLNADPLDTRTQRLEKVRHSLQGIGGSRSVGFGKKRIASLPDAVARVLDEYLYSDEPALPVEITQKVLLVETTAKIPLIGQEEETAVVTGQLAAIVNTMRDPEKVQGIFADRREASSGEHCPDCGNILAHGEGCVTCHHCGYSRC